MPRYMVDCYEEAVRFRTVAVEADSAEEAKEFVELNIDKVDLNGAVWNTERLGTEDVWREDDE